MPLISVLLPTHNRSELLALSVASVLAQTESDFELLVVGDGCTDDTGSVLAGFNDPRIRFFDLPKGMGFGYANRNVALREAQGDLIAFASDDDLMLPDHLAHLSALFRRPAVVWAYCRPLWIRSDGVILPAYANLRHAPARKAFDQQLNMIAAGCVMHRRSCFDEVGYWPQDIPSGGDWDLWKRILDGRPPGAIGFERRPGQLHFRAEWRADDLLWPRFLSYLSAMADSSGSWPVSLRLPEGPEHELQARSWAAMQQNPTQFANKLRAAVDILQDRLAWNASQNPDFR